MPVLVTAALCSRYRACKPVALSYIVRCTKIVELIYTKREASLFIDGKSWPAAFLTLNTVNDRFDYF